MNALELLGFTKVDLLWIAGTLALAYYVANVALDVTAWVIHLLVDRRAKAKSKRELQAAWAKAAEEILKRGSRTMFMDPAGTYFKRGGTVGNVQGLPIVVDPSMKDDQVKVGYPPLDAEGYALGEDGERLQAPFPSFLDDRFKSTIGLGLRNLGLWTCVKCQTKNGLNRVRCYHCGYDPSTPPVPVAEAPLPAGDYDEDGERVDQAADYWADPTRIEFWSGKGHRPKTDKQEPTEPPPGTSGVSPSDDGGR